MNKLSSRSFRRSFCFAACAALSKFHILLWHAISTHQREVFERIFNGKLTQFWQSNTRHTVTKASRSYVLALAHSFLKLSWIRVCFLCRGMESRARTTSGPGDRKRSEHGFLIYLSRPPPTTPPLRSVACLCSANLCNVLSNDIIIALADILHCQTSKQYTGGWRNGFHYPHIHHPDEGFLFERGKRGRRGSCLDESEANCYV